MNGVGVLLRKLVYFILNINSFQFLPQQQGAYKSFLFYFLLLLSFILYLSFVPCRANISISNDPMRLVPYPWRLDKLGIDAPSPEERSLSIGEDDIDRIVLIA